jgi:molybdopterin-guanine dinucleotide biosynthesis protein A
MRAIVLAGGRASRLGGIDKTALPFRGQTLLEHAIAAAEGAEDVVVVGAGGPPGVRVVREEPAGGGPVAALAAGLAALDPRDEDTVAVLAGDQPNASAGLAAVLAAPAGTGDGRLAVDEDGRRQPLLAVYREGPLRAALARLGDPEGASLRELLSSLDLTEVPLPAELCADVDTPADAAALGIPIPSGRSVR